LGEFNEAKEGIAFASSLNLQQKDSTIPNVANIDNTMHKYVPIDEKINVRDLRDNEAELHNRNNSQLNNFIEKSFGSKYQQDIRNTKMDKRYGINSNRSQNKAADYRESRSSKNYKDTRENKKFKDNQDHKDNRDKERENIPKNRERDINRENNVKEYRSGYRNYQDSRDKMRDRRDVRDYSDRQQDRNPIRNRNDVRDAREVDYSNDLKEPENREFQDFNINNDVGVDIRDTTYFNDNRDKEKFDYKDNEKESSNKISNFSDYPVDVSILL